MKLMIFAAAMLSSTTIALDTTMVSKRSSNFITKKSPQDLCGDSTFVVDNSVSPGSVANCKKLRDNVPTGLWDINGFSGSDFQRMTTAAGCVFSVRHSDGGSGDVYVGSQDLYDLANYVILDFANGNDLPRVTGKTACSYNGKSANVEWEIYK